MRPGAYLITLVAALMTLCAGCAGGSRNSEPVPPPQQTSLAPAARPEQSTRPLLDKTPDFALSTVDGGTFRLSEQSGRVVGVYVMASWCGTCIPETQAWDRLLSEQAPRGLTAVAVSGDPGDTPDDVRHFATLAKAQHPIWALDPKAAFMRLFTVRSLDTTLLFDRAGKLVYRNSVPMSYDALRQEVEKIL